MHLFKSSYILVSEGFKVDVQKIRQYLNSNVDDSGIVEQELSNVQDDTEETEVSLNGFKANTNENKSAERKKFNGNKESVEETGEKTFLDLTKPSTSGYIRKFIWPEQFLNRESRKDSDPVEPIEPKDVGKQSTRPFFGQVVESLGPRLNSTEQKGWNLCFKLERKGESVQIWAFGSETEVKSLESHIQLESYIVYWGNYTVAPRTSNNLNPTSDWIIKMSTKTSCIGKVSLVMSKAEEEVQEHGETKEKFSAKFRQPAKITAKRRMKEKSFEEKKKIKLDTDQSKITQFLNVEEDSSLILHYESSDSLDKGVEKSRSGSKDSTTSPTVRSPYSSSSSLFGSPRESTPSPYYSPSPDQYTPVLDLSISSDSN